VYSGGLGILAGDHCKAASDLGVPLVGVGPHVPLRLLPADGGRGRFPAAHLSRLRLRAAARAARGGAGGRRAHRAHRPAPAASCRPRSGRRRSGRCRCSCWTPTSPSTTPRTARSPACSTCAAGRCACARRSCWAWAECAPCAPSASTPRSGT
jgi:hypothetical protein